VGVSFDPNWQRISRWSLLGAIVMVLWLLFPTAKCAVAAFRAEPLSETMPQSDGVERVQEPGFFERWGKAIKGCYAQTPLLEQEAWKRNVLFALAGVWLVTWGLHSFEKSRKRGYDR
jgi:hypothetical protein